MVSMQSMVFIKILKIALDNYLILHPLSKILF